MMVFRELREESEVNEMKGVDGRAAIMWKRPSPNLLSTSVWLGTCFKSVLWDEVPYEESVSYDLRMFDNLETQLKKGDIIESYNTLSWKGSIKIIGFNSWPYAGHSRNHTMYLTALPKCFLNSDTPTIDYYISMMDT
ncbi:hypothetical protein BTVI_09627 [Pitangus sulphuratus]|nr:hypothetical protein BTVI_09627 [Pitangus sulphuratus]